MKIFDKHLNRLINTSYSSAPNNYNPVSNNTSLSPLNDPNTDSVPNSNSVFPKLNENIFNHPITSDSNQNHLHSLRYHTDLNL